MPTNLSLLVTTVYGGQVYWVKPERLAICINTELILTLDRPRVSGSPLCSPCISLSRQSQHVSCCQINLTVGFTGIISPQPVRCRGDGFSSWCEIDQDQDHAQYVHHRKVDSLSLQRGNHCSPTLDGIPSAVLSLKPVQTGDQGCFFVASLYLVYYCTVTGRCLCGTGLSLEYGQPWTMALSRTPSNYMVCDLCIPGPSPNRCTPIVVGLGLFCLLCFCFHSAAQN